LKFNNQLVAPTNQLAVRKAARASVFIFESNNQLVTPTNWQQQRKQSKWWCQMWQFIISEINNQLVAPANQLAARKAAKASVF